jgi:hypothetical protein
MSFDLEAIAAQGKEVELPTDPAELAKARGDLHEPAEPTLPKAEPAKAAEEPAKEVPLTEEDKKALPVVEDKKDEAAAEPEPERDEKGRFIPRARFNEAQDKAKARIAALEAQLKATAEELAKLEVPKELSTAEKALEEQEAKYVDLLADGKLDEAKAVRKEINKLNRQIVQLEMAPQQQTATVDVLQQQVFQQTVEFYTDHFPEFAEGEGKKQELVDEVAEYQTAFAATGMAPAAALSKAADTVIRIHGLQPFGDRKEPAKAASPAAARKAAAVTTNIEAAKRQPPSLSDVGVDSDKAGAGVGIPLTLEEFEKLPESAIRRLRGDDRI